MTIRFRAEAARDVMSAREWYDAQRAGWGDEFARVIDEIGVHITEFPESFPEIGAGCRRALLPRFP